MMSAETSPDRDFALENAFPPARAIRAMCVQCTCGARSDITNCTASADPNAPHGCTLYPFRAGRGKDFARGHPAVSRRKAMRMECLRCMGGSRKGVRTCSSTSCPLWPYRHGVGVEDGRGHRLTRSPSKGFQKAVVSDGGLFSDSAYASDEGQNQHSRDEIGSEEESGPVWNSGHQLEILHDENRPTRPARPR